MVGQGKFSILMGGFSETDCLWGGCKADSKAGGFGLVIIKVSLCVLAMRLRIYSKV